MDVWVLTRGWLLDHTLAGVFSTAKEACRAFALPKLSEKPLIGPLGVPMVPAWTHPDERTWTCGVSNTAAQDQRWVLERVTLDEAAACVRAADAA